MPLSALRKSLQFAISGYLESGSQQSYSMARRLRGERPAKIYPEYLACRKRSRSGPSNSGGAAAVFFLELEPSIATLVNRESFNRPTMPIAIPFRFRRLDAVCLLGILCLAPAAWTLPLHRRPKAPARVQQSRHLGHRGRYLSAHRVLPSNPAPVPAKITFRDGQLTVRASNSELSQILTRVATISGMTVDGSIGSARIFGQYGPGNPSKVLVSLLAGSKINFVMVGNTPSGVPRQLLLSSQSATPPTNQVSAPPTSSASSGTGFVRPANPGPQPNFDQQGTSGSPNNNGNTPAQQPLGPGAVPNPPPPPSPDAQTRARQNLLRLQQMQQQVQRQAQHLNSPQP